MKTLNKIVDEVIDEFDRILDNSGFTCKPVLPYEVDWEKVRKFIRKSCIKVARKWKRLKLK